MRTLFCVLGLGASVFVSTACTCGSDGDDATPRPEVRTPIDEPSDPPSVASTPLFVAGGAHTCVRSEGPLRCWGKNDHGELGDATQIERSAPVTPALAASMESLAFGEDHACGLVRGMVHCWGDNRAGQLGDGTRSARTRPAPVAGLRALSIAQIAVGDAHSCARTNEGAVHCWGDNAYLQIGSRRAGSPGTARADDSHELVLRPRSVSLPERAEELVARGAQTCARLASGAVSCWGGSWSSGWLGDAQYRQEGRAPTIVREMAGASRLAVGNDFVCGIFDGRVRCYGENLYNQLGDPASDCCAEPPRLANVVEIDDASEIAASARFTCALRAGGAVSCWGTGLPALAGEARREERAESRPRTLIASGAVGIAGGSTQACARFEGDVVRCWGDDTFGQLGDGISRRVASPILISQIENATELAVGYGHMCAKTRSQGVRCWGAGDARHVEPLDAGHGLVAGIYETCAITSSSEATCVGRSPVGLGCIQGQPCPELAGRVRFGFEIASLAAGHGGICALSREGRVQCVEEYSDAHTIRLDIPERSAHAIQRGTGMTSLSMGERACGVSGTNVRCWRTESPQHSGSVGHVQGAPREMPFEASDPPIGVAAGDDMECTWTRAGRAFCWERPLDYEESPPEAPQPALVPSIEGVLEMSAGRNHVCARTASAVYCWGEGDKGQLGGGAIALEPQTVPVRVVGLPDGVAQIAAGGDHSCVRTEAGRVYCWGDDQGGALGRDAPAPPRGPVEARSAR